MPDAIDKAPAQRHRPPGRVGHPAPFTLGHHVEAMDDLMVMVDAACLASTFVLESAGGVSLWKRHVAA